jgi:Flp pilus assembly protein TadG
MMKRFCDPIRSRVPRERRGCGERGSELLEFALCSIILFTFLFGIIEYCLGIYSAHFVAIAAQQGTRYAAVRGSGCKAYTSACPASTTDIKNYVQNLAYPGITPTSVAVTTTYAAYPSGTTCTPSATCNNPGNLVTITVGYNYSLIIPFVPNKTLTFASTAAAIIAE